MKKISETRFVWASPHNPTAEQLLATEWSIDGVSYLRDTHADLFKRISNSPADRAELSALADEFIQAIARPGSDGAEKTVILQPAGSPAFQFALGRVLADYVGLKVPQVWYAHSERVSEDIPQEDGSVKKVSVFRHLGWIKM